MAKNRGLDLAEPKIKHLFIRYYFSSAVHPMRSIKLSYAEGKRKKDNECISNERKVVEIGRLEWD